MTQKIKSVISVKTKSGTMRVVEGEPFILPDIDDDRAWEVVVLTDEDKGVRTSLNGMTEFLRQKGRIRDKSLQVNAIRSVNPSAHPAIESPAHIITIGSKDDCSGREKAAKTQRHRRSDPLKEAIRNWDELIQRVRFGTF